MVGNIEVRPFFYLSDEDAVIYEVVFDGPLSGTKWRAEIHQKHLEETRHEAELMLARLGATREVA